MKRNPRYLLFAVFILILTACYARHSPFGQELPEEITIYFFHDTACGTCDGTEEFFEVFNDAVGPYQEEYPYNILSYNVFKQSGMEYYTALTDEYGLSRENLSFPLMIINGKIYSGMDGIRDNLCEAYLTAGEDIFIYEYLNLPNAKSVEDPFKRYQVNKEDSTFVYFYRITCDECKQTKSYLDTLPQTVNIEGEASAVHSVPINTRSGNNSELIQEFFSAYGVPEDDQMVPIVFLKDRYFAGYQSISESLSDALVDGEGLAFQFPG